MKQLDNPSGPANKTGDRLRQALVIAICSALGGCQRVPSITVLGAFFPSWMLCAIVGTAMTLVIRWVFMAAGVDGELGPRSVVYPALALTLGLGTWILLFRG